MCCCYCFSHAPFTETLSLPTCSTQGKLAQLGEPSLMVRMTPANSPCMHTMAHVAGTRETTACQQGGYRGSTRMSGSQSKRESVQHARLVPGGGLGRDARLALGARGRRVVVLPRVVPRVRLGGAGGNAGW